MTRNPIDDRSPEIVGSLAGLSPDSASTAFTPGPWRVQDACSYALPTGRFEIASDEWVVASTIGDETELHEQEEANARLIAAAPELLEAAERALNYIANTEGELGIVLDSGDALRAAIAKARGQ